MVTRRPGHSLPELIVTVTFLGVALGGVGASSLLGARWALDGLRRQEAVRLAAVVLDSVALAETASSGARKVGGWQARWEVEAGGRIVVLVEGPPGTVAARLEGRRAPSILLLPDPPLDDAVP